MTDPQEHPVRGRGRGRARTALAVGAAAATVTVTALLGLAAPASASGPSVTVTPSSGLSDGQTVTVNGSGFTPNFNQMVVVECAATATGAAGCDTNDVKFVKADASGAFSTPLTVRSTFGSTDCTKVECIVQAHEGVNPSTGKTGTSSALHFGSAGGSGQSSTPPPSSSGGSASTGAGGSGNAGSGSNAGNAGSGNGGVGGVSSGLPTGANAGQAAVFSAPLVSELAAAAALLLLLGAALLYRRRRSA